jgi:hypothetical protein
VRAGLAAGKAISMAVHNNKVTQRFTALEWRLGPVTKNLELVP